LFQAFSISFQLTAVAAPYRLTISYKFTHLAGPTG